jgi:hypothetical protein
MYKPRMHLLTLYWEEFPNEGVNTSLRSKVHLLPVTAAVSRKVLWIGAPCGGRKLEGVGGILLGDSFVVILNFHLINDLSANKLARGTQLCHYERQPIDHVHENRDAPNQYPNTVYQLP